MSKRKLKEMWQLFRAKHYALLLADSDEEISWAIESLRKADELAKSNK
jgi:hypothetical protein